VLTASLTAGFFQPLGYLATAFLLVMYLQGIRGLNPLQASLVLVPGYTLASVTGPLAGRLSDRFGSRLPATLGSALTAVTTLAFSFVLSSSTPLLTVVALSSIGGVGSSLFFPASNSAVMANSPKEHYGAVSGILRTLGNTGILLSYVIAITAASASVPREVAFEVFLGTTNLIGGVSTAFVEGLRSAFRAMFFVTLVAVVLSALRGKERRGQAVPEVLPA
jgi:MFS family permease